MFWSDIPWELRQSLDLMSPAALSREKGGKQLIWFTQYVKVLFSDYDKKKIDFEYIFKHSSFNRRNIDSTKREKIMVPNEFWQLNNFSRWNASASPLIVVTSSVGESEDVKRKWWVEELWKIKWLSRTQRIKNTNTSVVWKHLKLIVQTLIIIEKYIGCRNGTDR